jgi:hypothetical protein
MAAVARYPDPYPRHGGMYEVNEINEIWFTGVYNV